jgi:hypothetical protein
MKGDFVHNTERSASKLCRDAREGEREGDSLGVVIVVVETLTSFDIPKFHNFIVASGESRLGVGTEHS